MPARAEWDGDWTKACPIYYGWVGVVLAAAAMTATLPGRTHGLGLITEPLLADLSISHTDYSRINLASSLLGALCCLPVGWRLDRYGVRRMLTVVTLLLAASVLAMSAVRGPVSLFASLLAVRGLGQSALSVVSMAIVGKWFRGRLGVAMGVFAVLLTFGFIASILGMGVAIERSGWRSAWTTLGLSLLGFSVASWVFARDTPEACGLEPDAPPPDADRPAAPGTRSSTLAAALRTPAFWAFCLGAAAFNFVWSGITLFNESILAERGLDADAAVRVMAILTGAGLLSNVLAGALASRGRLRALQGIGLAILAIALAAFPHVRTVSQAQAYGAAMGFTGGIITVVFFAAWGRLFGRARLGAIQGFAQGMTVIASALGPVLMAEVQAATGSYAAAFRGLSAAVAILAAISFVTPLPGLEPQPDEAGEGRPPG
ncbi:MAG: MFS transporter [Planctomyces sp.]|nr:MFS transporter [Planctomyces sp.]